MTIATRVRKAPHQNYRDVHFDRPLTNVAIAFFQNVRRFVSHRFFPIMRVMKASDKFDFYPIGYFNHIPETHRDEEANANSVGLKKIEKAYSVGDDALRCFVSDKKRANVDNQLALDRGATRLVTEGLNIRKEKDFADAYLATGKWTTDVQGVASPSGAQVKKWSDSSADPIEEYKTQRETFVKVSGGFEPNKGIITYDALTKISEHVNVVDRVVYGGSSERPAHVSVQALAELFELDELLVMQSIYNTALPGVEDAQGYPPVSNAFIAAGKFLVGYVPDQINLLEPAAGVTFLWDEYVQHDEEGGPSIRRYRGAEGKKGEYIEGEQAIDQNQVAPDLGMLFYDLV